MMQLYSAKYYYIAVLLENGIDISFHSEKLPSLGRGRGAASPATVRTALSPARYRVAIAPLSLAPTGSTPSTSTSRGTAAMRSPGPPNPASGSCSAPPRHADARAADRYTAGYRPVTRVAPCPSRAAGAPRGRAARIERRAAHRGRSPARHRHKTARRRAGKAVRHLAPPAGPAASGSRRGARRCRPRPAVTWASRCL